LEPIFQNHPLWQQVKKTLTHGFTMPLRELPEADRVADVLEALRYGNHKSTQKNPSLVVEMLNEEVTRGWQLVLPCNKVPVIPGTIVSPLGLVCQKTIDEKGNTTDKWRLTHDQSFKFQSRTSVTSRVDKEKLARCLYGTALRHFIHAILFYRSRFPTTPLLMAKFDLKSAYRRAHFSGVSALQSIATSRGLSVDDDNTDEELAYVSLCFTFGGSPTPSEFSILSEMIADLANVMIQHPAWHPRRLHSPFVSLTRNKPDLQPGDIPFAKSRQLLIDWNLNTFGTTEAYIDDIFTVFPCRSLNDFKRGRNAALLAIDTLGRPTHHDDPLP
jgi:hypothetical protein